MIVYWWRNQAKKSNTINQNQVKFKSMTEMRSIYLQNFESPNKHLTLSIDDRSLIRNQEQEESFLSEDSFFIDEKKNNNEKITISHSSSDNFSSIIFFSKQNFNDLSFDKKSKLINKIFEQNIYKNILKIISFCENEEKLFDIIVQKISSNINQFIKSEYNLLIFTKLFEHISLKNKSKIINKILKKTNEHILDEKGYKIILLLISFNKITIINIILYFILQKFIVYCNNPFSSQVIIALYASGAGYPSKQLNEKLIQNFNEISKFYYGMKIINEAKKYNDINYYKKYYINKNLM
jgi:hypothetical protein